MSLPKGPLYSHMTLRAVSKLRIQDTVPPGPVDSLLVILKMNIYFGTVCICLIDFAGMLRRYVIHVIRVGETISFSLNGTADVDEPTDPNLTAPFHEKRRWSYQEKHFDWHVPQLRGNLTLDVELRPISFAPLVGVAPGSVSKYDFALLAPGCDCGIEMPGFGNDCLHQEVLTLPGSDACAFLRSEHGARGRLRPDESQGSLSGRGSDLVQWLRDVSISGKSVVLASSEIGDSDSKSWRPLKAESSTDAYAISNLFRLSVPATVLLMKNTQLLVAATQDPTDAEESALPLRIVPHPPPIYLSTPAGDGDGFMLPEFSAIKMRTEYTACLLSIDHVQGDVLDSRFEVHEELVNLGQDCLKDEVKQKRFWAVRKKTPGCDECASYVYPPWNDNSDIEVTSSIVTCMTAAVDFDDRDAFNRSVESLPRKAIMRDKNHCNILQLAIRLNRPRMLDELLKYWDPASTTAEETPLGVAAAEGNAEMLESLIAHRAEVNVLDRQNRSALFHASHNCHSRAVDLLARMKADVNEMTAPSDGSPSGAQSKDALLPCCLTKFN